MYVASGDCGEDAQVPGQDPRAEDLPGVAAGPVGNHGDPGGNAAGEAGGHRKTPQGQNRYIRGTSAPVALWYGHFLFTDM